MRLNGKRNKWPEERAERLKVLYEQDVPMREIAKQLGCTVTAAYQARFNLGISRRQTYRKTNHANEQTKASVKQAYSPATPTHSACALPSEVATSLLFLAISINAKRKENPELYELGNAIADLVQIYKDYGKLTRDKVWDMCRRRFPPNRKKKVPPLPDAQE